MKKVLLSILFAVATLTTTGYAHGQKLQLEMPGYVTGVKKDEPAPYAGVLFSTEAAAYVLSLSKANPEMIDIDVLYARQEEQALCTKKLADAKTQSEADKKIAEAISQEQQTKIDILTAHIKEDEKASTPCTTCYLVGGIVAGAIVGTAATYIVTR